jgi:hypothetical protein
MAKKYKTTTGALSQSCGHPGRMNLPYSLRIKGEFSTVDGRKPSFSGMIKEFNELYDDLFVKNTKK